MSYTKLASINVNERLEKKNGLSYLSWAWAWDQLLRADPDAEHEYLPATTFPDGTMLVWCAVTAFGKRRVGHLPVMDYKNRAIQNPDAFAVNTAMQRCLVKTIALHGLGLYIYAGEDLPEGEEKPQHAAMRNGDGAGKITPASGFLEKQTLDMQNHLRDLAHRVEALHKKGDVSGAKDEWVAGKTDLDEEQTAAAWSLIDSKARSAIKALGQQHREAA